MSSEPIACAFDGCIKRRRSTNGLCGGHYRQFILGKPLSPLYATRKAKGTAPRIKYDEVPCPVAGLEGPCYVFRGYIRPDGYGQISVRHGDQPLAHKHVWEQAHGPIPVGFVMDHKCRVRACINVNHLRVVTRKVNATENVVGHRGQIEAAKTHCKQGHPFDEANTLIRCGRDGRPRRDCRECHRQSGRRRYAKSKDR